MTYTLKYVFGVDLYLFYLNIHLAKILPIPCQ